MANTQGMCTSFKVDLMNGLHAFGTSVVRAGTTADTFKGALYLTTATINASTTAYTATGEVSGTGYTANGGTNGTLTNATAPAASGTAAIWTPSASIAYGTVTLSTAFDTVLIYNSTSSGKNAVSVHTFGAQTISGGSLTLTMPAGGLGTSLLQIT